MLHRTHHRSLVRLLLLGGLSSVCMAASCPRFARQDRPSAVVTSPPPPENVATRLGPGDAFEVRVVQEPDLTGLYRVGADGGIDFPFCGRLTVEGQTAGEVSARLKQCLSDGYLRDPQVTVVSREWNSKKVMVFGHVKAPGLFSFEDRMTVVQAITLAGGFVQFAAQNKVVVTREESGTTKKHVVPVQDIGLGTVPDFYLRPGDTIYVPESAI